MKTTKRSSGVKLPVRLASQPLVFANNITVQTSGNSPRIYVKSRYFRWLFPLTAGRADLTVILCSVAGTLWFSQPRCRYLRDPSQLRYKGWFLTPLPEHSDTALGGIKLVQTART